MYNKRSFSSFPNNSPNIQGFLQFVKSNPKKFSCGVLFLHPLLVNKTSTRSFVFFPHPFILSFTIFRLLSVKLLTDKDTRGLQRQMTPENSLILLALSFKRKVDHSFDPTNKWLKLRNNYFSDKDPTIYGLGWSEGLHDDSDGNPYSFGSLSFCFLQYPYISLRDVY